MTAVRSREIVFESAQTAVLEEFDLPSLQPEHVLVKTISLRHQCRH
ncbi:hypothetical protein [Herbiconiux ginsengi]|uniref:Uncharacterized protein n=1 Tax=Herbiconiux ginsengi TaxID=381665 RepID=A0A1H3LLU8_9MICO|nr:hypothetical protein [Herbiconiux ginsengi]SDY65381.1 hypothetical protein SAMN05216554_1039 [Herbiconiux ginsengi]